MLPFPRYTHHICLVSAQTLPNYLGSTEPGAEAKKVHLLVSQRMQRRAIILEKALRDFGIDVATYPIEGLFAEDIVPVLETIYKETGKDTAINVTGGTKIMALTAVEWAASLPSAQRPFVFYVDTEHGRYLHIEKSGQIYEIQKRLSLQEILNASAGAKITDQSTDIPDQKEVVLHNRLIKTFLSDVNILPVFKKIVDNGEKNLHSKIEELEISDIEKLKKCNSLYNTLEELTKSGIFSVEYDIDKFPTEICFSSEYERQWCDSIWLNRYVLFVLDNLHKNGKIEYFCGNIKIDERVNDVHNEYNIESSFIYKNKLFIIECRTDKLKQTDDSSISSHLANYNSKNLGGALSRGLIVTIQKPTDDFLEICEIMKIKVFYGEDLRKLDEKICEWIENAS